MEFGLNHLKKKRPLLLDETSEASTMNILESTEKQPDQILAEEELTKQIHEDIAKLPPRYRLILTLFHLQQMTYTEIAVIMALPVGTVKSYLFRARKMLKTRWLQEQIMKEWIA